MVVFFPEELLISEILVRIPAKELLKFKSVCKRWRFLISDPKFTAEHLRYSKPDNQIIFSINLPDTSHPPLCEVDCYSINMQEITPPEFQRPFKDIFSIKYSCNGMLLLLDMNISCKNLIIYNPVTRVRKDLPPAPKDCINWALVLDASTGKYKVFGITLIDCFVFTQGEIDWMYLHTLALPTFIREEKHRSDLISLENKLYWTEPFWQKNNAGEKWSINLYSIDIAHEEHITKNKIPFGVNILHRLSQVSGSLYITNYFDNSLETWVIKDMAKNLWSKCCSIGYGSLLPGRPYLPNFVPRR